MNMPTDLDLVPESLFPEWCKPAKKIIAELSRQPDEIGVFCTLIITMVESSDVGNQSADVRDALIKMRAEAMKVLFDKTLDYYGSNFFDDEAQYQIGHDQLKDTFQDWRKRMGYE